MPSLLLYRRDVMPELGPFVVNTTSTASTDLVSFTCASLISANGAGGNLFQHSWAYLNATTGANLAGQRAILSPGGYDADNGAFTVARTFATSVASSVGFEISTKLPAITDELGTIGARELINEALLSMPPLDLLPVSGVTNQAAYDLTTTYPWLTDKSQILGIYYQYSGDDYPRETGYGWDWLYDADAPRLLLPGKPFITGQTFYLKVYRPAQTWVKTGGTWAADTDGLQNDTDEALPLRSVMKATVLAAAYRHLGSAPGPDEYARHYREREAFWTTKAYAMRWWDAQQAEETAFPRLRMVGGGGYGQRRAYA